jgi:hypothetical protein
MTLAYASGRKSECGVTQDKSACVQLATITNGGGGFMRVMADRCASRMIGQINCNDWDLARVGFVQTVYDKWCIRSPILNDDRPSSVAIWCRS